jgi:3-hydroxyacyl-CoA dehydrogenase / enoyl-CoA hydratase / 3-hydroxybutyryl-CoA epimerase
VKLKAARHELVRAGVARARNRIEWEARQGRITQKQVDARGSLIQGVTGFGGFGALDLVLAVAEEGGRGVTDLLAETEPHVDESCVLAFQDWAASATRVQRELTHPERVVGIAAALPLERFRLVEIVPGAQTGPDALHAVNRLLRKAGRTPLVVSDQTPTPATRLIGALFAESGRLLDEGATLEQVDNIAIELGFEVGPFHRIDAIGSRRVLRMLETLGEALGDRMAPGSHLARIGREAGTLYRYRGGHPAGSNPSLPAGLSPGGEALTRLIRERLLLILINEAALILEDGSLTDPGDVEVISILGLGLSGEKGGLLFQAEEWGIDGVVTTLSKRADRHGQRFAPADLLLAMAREGRRFFVG